MKNDPIAVARASCDAYVSKDRAAIEALIADDFHFTWVETAKLWSAMNTTDADAGQTRGYLLVRSQRPGE
jgi:ketosteroid isomerase-like protein